jgi:hypothetical protein
MGNHIRPSYNIKAQYAYSPSYRKAKSDWPTTAIGFIIIFGTMFAVFVAGILVGVPEQ